MSETEELARGEVRDVAPWSVHGAALLWVVQIVLMVLGLDEAAWPLLVGFIAVIVVSVIRLYLQRATARGVLVAIAVILVLASVLQGQVISTAVLVPALAGGLLSTTAARRWVLPDPVPGVEVPGVEVPRVEDPGGEPTTDGPRATP